MFRWLDRVLIGIGTGIRRRAARYIRDRFHPPRMRAVIVIDIELDTINGVFPTTSNIESKTYASFDYLSGRRKRHHDEPAWILDGMIVKRVILIRKSND